MPLLEPLRRVRDALRRPSMGEPPAGLRDRLLSIVAKVLAPMHPTNPSGNNMSQR